MIPVSVMTWPIEATRTPNSACVWIAEATVEGRTNTARSRHGAANELARHLVAAGLADRPMVIRHHGLAGTTTYPSFHAAAMWTFGEGERTLRRIRYRQPPEGGFLGSGTGQKCVSSPMAGDMEGLSANRRKAEAPSPAIEISAALSGVAGKSCPTPGKPDRRHGDSRGPEMTGSKRTFSLPEY